MKDIKIVIRIIAQNPDPKIGAFDVRQVEEYIGEFLKDGWTLFSVNYVGQAPEGYIYTWMLVR